MDESWRIRMEMPSRRSIFHGHRKPKPLAADDFTDVFGGPPRTVSGRKSAAAGGSFYEEIFRVPAPAPARRSGRNLRAFTIPVEKNDEFYSDIFGNDRTGRARHRARKVESSSEEELSPIRSAKGEDVEMNSFASKLRPVNVSAPSKWNSSTMKPSAAADHPKNKRWMAAGFSHDSPSAASENQYMESFAYKSSYQGFSSRNVSSPDTTRLKPDSFRVTRLAASDFDDDDLQSSSSHRSSLCQEWEDKGGFQGDNNILDGNNNMQEQEQEQEQEQDDDEDEQVMSPYVIEIKSDHYREDNNDAIDEAVAWVKERHQRQERTKEYVKTEHSSIPITEDKEVDKWTTEAKQQSQKDMELKLLDKEVELWSSGKESNIRLLLSSLHQILWPNSSWHVVPLTNIIDRSRVKKAYKKAQLCLHPDKVQQRGATPTQKYVAAKVFVILQDAWDTFITQDVLLVRG